MAFRIDSLDAHPLIRGRRVVLDGPRGRYGSYVIVQGEPTLKHMRWLVLNELLVEVPDEPRQEDLVSTGTAAK